MDEIRGEREDNKLSKIGQKMKGGDERFIDDPIENIYQNLP